MIGKCSGKKSATKTKKALRLCNIANTTPDKRINRIKKHKETPGSAPTECSNPAVEIKGDSS